MRKFESIEYMRRLGLPTPICREFKYNQLGVMYQYWNWLTDSGFGTGLRTDYSSSILAGTNLPFIMNVQIHELRRTVQKYGDILTYILSECMPLSDVLVHAILYILPGYELLAYGNFDDKVPCRQAMERPNRPENIIEYRESWRDLMYNEALPTQVRHILKRAALKDDSIIGKRIEFSRFKRRGFIFWQMSEDYIL